MLLIFLYLVLRFYFCIFDGMEGLTYVLFIRPVSFALVIHSLWWKWLASFSKWFIVSF